MQLSVSEKYPQAYRLTAQWARNSVSSPRGLLWP